jgi:beta-aspartyl-peptidase (threonine type)
MRKAAIGSLVILALFSTVAAGDSQAVQDIQKVLADQAAAWNAKNLEGFMAYYWKSEGLTFQSGPNRLRGWQTMLDRYKKNYAGDKWGVLSFSDLEVNVLAPDAAYVLGRWKLDGTAQPLGGVFTLVFRKFPEGWRIVHDHTS